MAVGRPLRYVPEDTLVEVTSRTLHGRFLLKPDPLLNEIVIGALARALRRYEVQCCFFVAASNHFHGLLIPKDARELARFMGYFNSKIAREAGRLYGWGEKIFPRRYQAIVVTGEPSAQIARLKYSLSHGVKENLVERVEEWPGVHGVHSLLTGEPMTGIWRDRTGEYFARRRGKEIEPRQFVTTETLTLAPLPCWKDLPPEKRQELAAGLVKEIDEEAAAERARTGKSPLGRAGVLAQHPHDHPERPKKSPAPLVHAASKAFRLEFRQYYAAFVADFREGAEKLKRGDLAAPFPPGSFPPALPFVGG